MSSQDGGRHVLAVEDHPPTAELLTTALAEVDPPVSTRVVHDGSDCLAALRDPDSPAPDIVLLDLDLPDIDGFTVLEEMNDDPGLRWISAIVVSGSDDPETIKECYDRGAAGFISKPDDFDDFLSIAETVTEYWFSTTELPPGTGPSNGGGEANGGREANGGA